MSGGDGKGYGGGFQGGGNINGQAGPGGPNKGGNNNPYSDGSGWSSENDPFGLGGNPGGSGGNSGNHNNNGGGNKNQSVYALGVPALVPAVAGGFDVVAASGVSVLGKILSFVPRINPLGAISFAFIPTPIAKEDTSKFSIIINPANSFSVPPVGGLPLTQATVDVDKRIVDVVKDKKQHLAVISTPRPMSVPVVHAKPTGKPRAYSISLPGLPNITIHTTKGIPGVTPVTKPQNGFKEEKADGIKI